MLRLPFFLACITYTYVNAMPIRPREGHPVVHMNYQRIPNLPGLIGLKEQIMVAAHQESMLRAEKVADAASDVVTRHTTSPPQISSDSDQPEIPELHDIALKSRVAAVGQATPSACVNGFQTYADTTWDLMGLPFTIAYTAQACINACAASGSNCAAAVWYNGNACVQYTQSQTVGQIMTSSPNPSLPRTLITRCTTTITSAPATQAPATQAPATQAPVSTSSSGSCSNGFTTYSDATFDLMGLPYTVAYSASSCLSLCASQTATTCAAAVWYNGNACVQYTQAQAQGKVISKSPDPTLPRTLFVRCSGAPVVATSAPTQTPATQTPATQTPATQAPATKAPTAAPTQPPATQAPVTNTQYPQLSLDTSAPGSNGIAYNGGTVMTNPVKVYLVYYGSWTTTAAQQEISIINTFVSNLGTSQWWNIQTSYYQPNPSTGARAYVQNGVTLGGYAVTGIDGSNGGTSLTDAQVAIIISNQIKSGKISYSPDAVYIMISSAEVYETGFCTSDCGWHSAAAVSGTSNVMKYGWVGDATTQCPGSCTAFGGSVSPNGNKGADGIISILAHEIAESVSDPYLNAWRQSDYTENADKCAWNFGSTYTTANGGKANVNVGGHDYLVQSNWKNRDGGGCVLHL